MTIVAFLGATSSSITAADKFVGFYLMKGKKVKDDDHNVLVEILTKNGMIEDDQLIIKEKELLQYSNPLHAMKAKDCYQAIESILSKNYSKLRLYSISIQMSDNDTSEPIYKDGTVLGRLASHDSASDAVATLKLKYDAMIVGIHFSMFAYFLMAATVGTIIAGILYATGYFYEEGVSEKKNKGKARA